MMRKSHFIPWQQLQERLENRYFLHQSFIKKLPNLTHTLAHTYKQPGECIHFLTTTVKHVSDRTTVVPVTGRIYFCSTCAARLSSSGRWVSPATALAVTSTWLVVLLGESSRTVLILVSICSLSWKVRGRRHFKAPEPRGDLPNITALPPSLRPADPGSPQCLAYQKPRWRSVREPHRWADPAALTDSPCLPV